MFFTRFARTASRWLGHPAAFLSAVAIIVLWALCGPLFHFSSDWQLWVNTGTTVVTFLMVFLIQNTQSRDSEAIQLKLDEIIRVLTDADNSLLDMEEREQKDLTTLRTNYAELARDARESSSGSATQ